MFFLFKRTKKEQQHCIFEMCCCSSNMMLFEVLDLKQLSHSLKTEKKPATTSSQSLMALICANVNRYGSATNYKVIIVSLFFFVWFVRVCGARLDSSIDSSTSSLRTSPLMPRQSAVASTTTIRYWCCCNEQFHFKMCWYIEFYTFSLGVYWLWMA